MKKVHLLFFLLFYYSYSLCQPINIKGKVVDKISGKPLSQVSIIINSYKGTLTNSKGEFAISVDEKIVTETGITFSYVGYQKKQINYSGNRFLDIALELSEKTIAAVTVFGNTKAILQKAIQKIPSNYLEQPSIQKGIIRVYNIVNDSDYFYKSDAIVKIFFPAYTKYNDEEQITVIQNKQILLKNKKSKYAEDLRQIKWVGGFNSIPDLIHTRPGFIKLNELKYYEYYEREKTIFENRKVYVIDFHSRNKKEVEGTLYIDTATFAFVGIDLTEYNIKNLFFIPIAVAKRSVRYELINGKWYIKNTHSESRHVIKIQNNNYIADYARISLDTAQAQAFSYSEIIQGKDENIKINKQGNENDWQNCESIINSKTSSGELSDAPIPHVDTGSYYPSRKKKILHSIFNYLYCRENISESFLITRLPVKITGFNKGNFLAPTALNINLQFRIYKNLFFEWDNATNFGLDDIKINQTGLYLNYKFEINTAHRPITLVLLSGYNTISLSGKEQVKNGKIYNWSIGFPIGIELTHKKSVFINCIYNEPFFTKINEPNINTSIFSFSAGIQCKL
ncbi:MAG: carboxypeptidase-like regulatory domain-containing protein [Bacteroidetes bacterium]|nr:carboxypeptidase-like regulatory domain-containing protein [Bacteroidota bacterium]